MSDALLDGSDTSDAMFRWRIGLGRFPGTRDEWRAAMRGIYGPVWDEMERVRRENAEARERWRERVLQGLYGINGSTGERPCASCGYGGFWYVCMACSTGAPRKHNSTWRINPTAAARIRAKAYARRNEPALPLP